VWSLNALAGMDEEPSEGEEVLDAAVVVVVELLELHAAAPRATARTMPSAADRIFHDADCKAPPSYRMIAGVGGARRRADTNM
jgi:hypothetical protein